MLVRAIEYGAKAEGARARHDPIQLHEAPWWREVYYLKAGLNELMRAKVLLEPGDLHLLCTWLLAGDHLGPHAPILATVRLAERLLRERKLNDQQIQVLALLRDGLCTSGHGRETRKLGQELATLLRESGSPTVTKAASGPRTRADRSDEPPQPFSFDLIESAYTPPTGPNDEGQLVLAPHATNGPPAQDVFEMAKELSHQWAWKLDLTNVRGYERLNRLRGRDRWMAGRLVLAFSATFARCPATFEWRVYSLARIMLHIFDRLTTAIEDGIEEDARDIIYSLTKMAPISLLSGRGLGFHNAIRRCLREPIAESTLDLILAMREAFARDPFEDNRRVVAPLDQQFALSTGYMLERGDRWADAWVKQVPKDSPAWRDLFELAFGAKGSTPPRKWLISAGKAIASVTRKKLLACIEECIPLVGSTRPGSVGKSIGGRDLTMMADDNLDTLRGLVWMCRLLKSPGMPRLLGQLAVASYKKVPGIGPRFVKVGNACIDSLAAIGGMPAAAELSRLVMAVKFGTAQKLLDKALQSVAQKLGLPRDEIEEMAAPTYGLEEVGLRRESFDGYTAELRVAGATAEIAWKKPDGKPLKSAPAAIKKAHAEELKELSVAVKDIQRMLPAQRDRVDTLHLARKTWAFPVWRERYLDHPLVGVIARRLIWRFVTNGKPTDGVSDGEQLIDERGRVLDKLGDGTQVSLWHPIGQPVEAVLAWRSFLEERQVQQPFKQAHREVYVLTDAERNTGTYSNRYAAHVLRQHQFNALCAARGWKNKLRLLVDAEYPPATLHLPRWNLRAEYWIEGIGNDYGTDTNEAGVYHRISTDQVRFYPLDAVQARAHAGGGGYEIDRNRAVEPLPLEQIPPLVFSEVMRDVDLFVGVASVGNDPAWQDGGPDHRFRDYWNEFAFAELTETSKTRKAVLEKLIPRLAIADRCRFEGKFLVVRGDLRTYKIHLGSSNILMEPNDAYLCIVPSRGAALGKQPERVFLPFEGDERLSVILSKALMLAADTKITDSSIVSQIRRK